MKVKLWELVFCVLVLAVGFAWDAYNEEAAKDKPRPLRCRIGTTVYVDAMVTNQCLVPIWVTNYVAGRGIVVQQIGTEERRLW